MTGEPIRPQVKPTKRVKEPSRLRAIGRRKAARIAAGEERPGLRRTWIKRTPPPPVVGEEAGRMEFSRHAVCCVRELPGHICRGDIQCSHERNPQGGLPTGGGRKEDARLTVGMCAQGHLVEWHGCVGPFEGWSKQQRHDFMLLHYTALNDQWDALTPEAREWWVQLEAVNRKKRSEALRAAL